MEELKASIVALTTEVTELRSVVQRLEAKSQPSLPAPSLALSASDSSPSWTTVVKRGGSRRKGKGKLAHNGAANPTDGIREVTDKTSTYSPSRLVELKGVRRIWGTMKATTATAVTGALKRLTSIGEKVTVRRKFKTTLKAGSPPKTKWWFVVRGTEAELQQLQQEWVSVATQTAWKLEPAFSYADEPTTERHPEQLEQPPASTLQPERPEQTNHCPPVSPSNTGVSPENNAGEGIVESSFLEQ